MAVKTDYTREELIEICERAIVPQSKWEDRDSESAQHSVGRVWQLLKCGCEFSVLKEGNTHNHNDRCVTDDHTIWIKFWVHNFSWVENAPHEEGENEHDGYDQDSSGESLFFYLPTKGRLEVAHGEDWY